MIDDRFGTTREVSAIIAYHRPGGLTEADLAEVDAEARSLCDSGAVPDLKSVTTPSTSACGDLGGGLAPETPPSQVSADHSTVLVSVDTTSEDTRDVVRDVATLRRLLPHGPLTGLVTGEAGFATDASNAFEGIDQTLLAITALLVLVLLLATYRSPIVALVPLVTVAIAYVVAAGVVYGLVRARAVHVTGQTTAILIVLMFGAGTDYCLLLVARAREEGGDVARATRRTRPAILSAGGTVIAAMLVLGLADYRATRTMGPVLALGVAVMVAAGLTLVPALLAVLPRVRATPPRLHVWERVGRLVGARPGVTAAVVLVVLGAGALGNLAGRSPLAFTETFRDPPESVRGLELIKAQFGAGRAAPADLVVAADRAPQVIAALGAHPAVANTTMVDLSRDQKLMHVSVELRSDPFADAMVDAIPGLRASARRAAGGHTALIGGTTAETHDSQQAQRADAALIVPLTLVLIFLIVAALVRALVAPLYLVGTVVLSYAFALGVSTIVFGESDPALPLFAFIFLVALGVDYNIFLIGRIREEHARLDHRSAVIAGLTRTGGVITSAGVILAGTFATLMAIPIEGLIQMGFTIAFGLLVDTLLVRSLLVPALAVRLGERNWWPSDRFR